MKLLTCNCKMMLENASAVESFGMWSDSFKKGFVRMNEKEIKWRAHRGRNANQAGEARFLWLVQIYIYLHI